MLTCEVPDPTRTLRLEVLCSAWTISKNSRKREFGILFSKYIFDSTIQNDHKFEHLKIQNLSSCEVFSRHRENRSPVFPHTTKTNNVNNNWMNHAVVENLTINTMLQVWAVWRRGQGHSHPVGRAAGNAEAVRHHIDPGRAQRLYAGPALIDPAPVWGFVAKTFRHAWAEMKFFLLTSAYLWNFEKLDVAYLHLMRTFCLPWSCQDS